VKLEAVGGMYAICGLSPDHGLPEWCVQSDPVLIMTRTPGELTIVCEERLVPDGVRCERGFRALRVATELTFSAVGVLAGVARPLADAGIPIMAYATYDTDYILLPAAAWTAACEALRLAGHELRD
jgi:hypothetical protein